MKLALFDLDNTLLDGDSDHAWAQYLIEEGVLHPAEYHAKNEWFYERYKDGTLDIHEFLDFQLAPIANRPREELDRWHVDFMQRKVRPMILPRAAELIASHSFTRATLPSRNDGVPRALPVNAPPTSSTSVATRFPMPSSRAMGAVMKLLVAVTSAVSAPACRAMRSAVPAWIMGRILRCM